MSLIFERYLEDEQSEREVSRVVDVPPRADDSAAARKRLLDNAKGGPIKPEDTKGVWL